MKMMYGDARRSAERLGLESEGKPISEEELPIVLTCIALEECFLFGRVHV